MALSSAERQASYRSRNRAAGVESEVADRPMAERLSTVIDLMAKRKLERMAPGSGPLSARPWSSREAALVDAMKSKQRQQYWQVGDRAGDQRAARAHARASVRQR